MKIALVNTYLKGGAGIACGRLRSALEKSGTNASMLVQEPVQEKEKLFSVISSRPQFFFSRLRLALEVMKVSSNVKSREDRFKFSIAKTGLDISGHPQIKNADIIHLHWINQGFLSLESIEKLTRLSKPIVWTLHDMWAFTGGCHYSRGCDHFITECCYCPYLKNPSSHDLSHQTWKRKKELLKKLNVTVVSCSDWLKNLAQQSSLLNDFRIENIPNPIDVNAFQPLDKEASRKRWGLPLTKKLIAFGAMDIQDKRKGFDYLASALKLLASLYPESVNEMEVIVIGKSKEDLSNKLPYKINQLGLISSSEDTASAYSASDIFVLPSLEDNLPNMVMESMACGTPVVAFHSGGIPEMIDHEKNGFLADYKSEQSLVKGIDFVLRHKNYEAFRSEARMKILKTYKEEVVAQQYNDLYQSIL